MKSNRLLHLATDAVADAPSPEYLSLWGLPPDAADPRAVRYRRHAAAVRSLIEAACEVAASPDLLTKPQQLAIREALDAITKSAALRDAQQRALRALEMVEAA